LPCCIGSLSQYQILCQLIEASKEGTLPKMSAALSEGASIDAVNEVFGFFGIMFLLYLAIMFHV
jgi:hypothetical protein